MAPFYSYIRNAFQHDMWFIILGSFMRMIRLKIAEQRNIYKAECQYGNPISVNQHMGQIMELRLSCYLILLSVDSKTR